MGLPVQPKGYSRYRVKGQALSIGELAKGTGVKMVTIRYYEQTGLLPRRTNHANYRAYRPEHARAAPLYPPLPRSRFFARSGAATCSASLPKMRRPARRCAALQSATSSKSFRASWPTSSALRQSFVASASHVMAAGLWPSAALWKHFQTSFEPTEQLRTSWIKAHEYRP